MIRGTGRAFLRLQTRAVFVLCGLCGILELRMLDLYGSALLAYSTRALALALDRFLHPGHKAGQWTLALSLLLVMVSFATCCATIAGY